MKIPAPNFIRVFAGFGTGQFRFARVASRQRVRRKTRRSIQFAEFQQPRALGEVVRLVELQQPRRGAPSIREAGKECAVAAKMLLPAVSPRMKQPRQSLGIGIDAREIRPLDGFAPAAGQRQVFHVW